MNSKTQKKDLQEMPALRLSLRPRSPGAAAPALLPETGLREGQP